MSANATSLQATHRACSVYAGLTWSGQSYSMGITSCTRVCSSEVYTLEHHLQAPAHSGKSGYVQDLTMVRDWGVLQRGAPAMHIQPSQEDQHSLSTQLASASMCPASKAECQMSPPCRPQAEPARWQQRPFRLPCGSRVGVCRWCLEMPGSLDKGLHAWHGNYLADACRQAKLPYTMHWPAGLLA